MPRHHLRNALFLSKKWGPPHLFIIAVGSLVGLLPAGASTHKSACETDLMDSVAEAAIRLSRIQKKEAKGTLPTRRGYRKEIDAWIKRSGVSLTQQQAARRLGISIDVLKSIMSEKGRIRYSQETLADVLKKSIAWFA